MINQQTGTGKLSALQSDCLLLIEDLWNHFLITGSNLYNNVLG